jgi:hypothetical protein
MFWCSSLAVTDDWGNFIQEQIQNAEKWAQENPLATGVIIITLATVGTFVASKAYDAWLKG